MSLHLYRLGRFSARRPWTVIGAWFVIAALVTSASLSFGLTLEDKFEIPGVDSERATSLLSEAQSDRAGLTAQVVLAPKDEASNFFDSTEAAAALARVQVDAAALPKVLGVSDTAGDLAAGREVAIANGTVSPDGRVAIIRVQYPVAEHLDQGDLDNLWAFAEEARTGSPLQVEAGGDIVFTVEEPESSIAELIGLLAAAIILFLAFRSLIAMGLPILIALFGLAVGISSMPLISHLVEIPGFAPQMASMIGIGVGIDYALFVLTRYREHLARGMTVVESAGRAVATAGQAVIFAGGTVVIAILGLAVAGLPALTAAGIATAVIVLLMVLAAISLLPALLGLAGHWINRIGLKQPGPASAVSSPSGWERWGEHVSRHAWPYAIGVTVLLLALTAPVLALQIGFPDDGTKPTSRSERRAYDLVAEGFGPGINGPLVIAIDISEDATIVEPLFEAVMGDPGIASVAPLEVNSAAGVATFFAFPTSSPQDSETFATIERLRSDVFPPVVADSPARAYIGGSTATWADMGNRVSDRLPWFIAAVVSLSFVLLMLVFRSILVPLKAAVLNLLSIGAAYGVLVVVFQWGWGAPLIGVETTLPIISFIPMFMFAVLFGLSMDYEVFLLSRVREEYLLTSDNQGSVIHGIARTGRVITSAALIMIAVFLGFVLGDDPVVKMMGLGLATAIFVDATIVRIVLVPATMKLMGNANWWIPAWLDRLLPTLHIEGETGLPEPEIGQDPIESVRNEPAVA